jgi:molybdenum cofactor cytidylyltransferase
MGANKLLADIGGKPMVRHAVEAAVASQADQVIVVTGHESVRVRAALSGLDVRFAQNDLYTEGLSTSVRAGVVAAEDADGVLICLGDMPGLTAQAIDGLIAAFNPAEGRGVVVPVHNGRRGNPVLWAQAFFPDLMTLTGDTGAKHLLAGAADTVCEVAIGNDGVLTDLDTPEALEVWRARA